MNRLNKLFQTKKERILSVYFTAGYPNLNDTSVILENLEAAGIDFVEIGMPFSDPAADGPVIQHASLEALKNGMSVKLLFEQLKDIRSKVSMPLVLMGYLNPVMQYGIEDFCQKCAEVGIDGLIMPDLPLQEYEDNYKALFEQHGLSNILLITPQTTPERLRQIDESASGFIYMVSSASTTGAKQSAKDFQTAYFERVKQSDLKNPRIIGFGISNKETFDNASQYAAGAIVGSAFVQHIGEHGIDAESVKRFADGIKA
ncbi:MAG: tryptophan synthase subunit alpha [Mangrovibacterium sp.]